MQLIEELLVNGGKSFMEMGQGERTWKLHISLRLVLFKERDSSGDVPCHPYAVGSPKQSERILALLVQNRVTYGQQLLVPSSSAIVIDDGLDVS